MYNLTKQTSVTAGIAVAAIASILFSLLYLLFEPTAMFAASDTNTFTVRQEIGAEIAFATASGNINMASTAIGGATGGTRFGSTTVAVTTNDSSGYTLDIRFESANGMEHETLGDFISYYGTTTPDYTMGLGVANSAFAYSVSSTNQVSAFDNNGSSCGAGTTKSIDNCFRIHGTPTADSTIVDSSSSATDEETIIGFQVQVAGGSGLSNGFYYATTTLTATTKS